MRTQEPYGAAEVDHKYMTFLILVWSMMSTVGKSSTLERTFHAICRYVGLAMNLLISQATVATKATP